MKTVINLILIVEQFTLQLNTSAAVWGHIWDQLRENREDCKGRRAEKDVLQWCPAESARMGTFRVSSTQQQRALILAAQMCTEDNCFSMT